MAAIDTPIDSKYLDQIKSILIQALKGKTATLYLFGSRAARTNNAVSDFDIAVQSRADLRRELSAARESLEMSNIPVKVDLVDLQSTSADFARKVITRGIVLWKN
jgi:predicted nucleotidyltransferase